jgi:hypothetical protein
MAQPCADFNHGIFGLQDRGSPVPPRVLHGFGGSLAHRAEGRPALGPVRLRSGAPLPEWAELLAEVLRLAQPERREGADEAGYRI